VSIHEDKTTRSQAYVWQSLQVNTLQNMNVSLLLSIDKLQIISQKVYFYSERNNINAILCVVNSLTSGHCGLKDHYGSITSLASSTSMISPQVQPLKGHYGIVSNL
jgi:hypothetical protein